MPDSRYVKVGGSRLYCETHGDGDPLLLLHGGLGTVQDFSSQTPVFANRFKVIAFERPGNGHTADIEGPFTFASMTRQAAAFIESLELGSVNVLGWSDGAIIAMLLAISRPDLVEKLVLVGGLADTEAQTAESRRWIESASVQSFPKFVVMRYEEASPDGPDHFKVVIEKTKKLWLNEPHITKEELGKIAAPTLVMAGDREDLPLEHTVDIFRAIKGAQLCIVPGATHFLMSERPDVVNAAVIRFFNGD